MRQMKIYKSIPATGTLIYPDGITSIEEYREDLISAYSLHNLVIPESVEQISQDTFKDCVNLEKVTLPAIFHKTFRMLFRNSYNIKEITFIGNMKDLDFSDWSWGNGYTESIYSKIFRNQKPIIYLDGENQNLKLGAKFYSRNSNAKQYTFFINNYIENVKVDGTDKWIDEDLFFRAPRFNENMLDGKLVNLTLCPRSTSYDDKRWSAPITINADAVTYIYPTPLQSYESDYEGCRLLLMGNRLEDISFEELNRNELYPHIDVWESYSLVYNALRNAGWNKNK